MADRIAVMHRGRLEQIGTGREIYTRPATPFVAEFVGESNKMEVEVTPKPGGSTLRLDASDGALEYGTHLNGSASALVYLRHEDTIVTSAANPHDGRLTGSIVDVKFIGDNVRLTVELPSGRSLLAIQRTRDFDRHALGLGDSVSIAARDGGLIVFAAERH